jgi:hypothetical protein
MKALRTRAGAVARLGADLGLAVVTAVAALVWWALLVVLFIASAS